jgi:VIT1/CCC1 family predicted Fe2+/Mn2+ transporter
MPSMPPSPHRVLAAFQISSLFPIEPWPSLKFAESEQHLVWCCSDHEKKPGRSASPDDSFSNPLVSASSGALSTAIGASIPVIPFFFMHGIEAVIAAAIISLAAHFAVGAAKSLITVRSWWSSGVEMTLVGAAEGVVTYGIGILLGKGGI